MLAEHAFLLIGAYSGTSLLTSNMKLYLVLYPGKVICTSRIPCLVQLISSSSEDIASFVV